MLQAQVEGLHWVAEPRFELEAALEQPDMLPTEPCHTLHSYKAFILVISLGDSPVTI
jgi:hypothetical protein